VLEEIDAALRGGGSAAKALEDLSGKFYQIIPHSFGRQRPPVINTQELLKEKFDLVAMLGDIEIAQTMQKDADNTDAKYAQLQTELTPLKQSDDVVMKIRKYIQATGGDASKLLEVWTCDRHGEGDRFAAHGKLDNRRLLWHGTNIAVVAAILKSGLRIMPTASSGSRVGRGIYLASEHSKSSGCVVRAFVQLRFRVESARAELDYAVPSRAKRIDFC
jgi:poly [ADP-ribose] polymerase 2/3/4